MLRKIPNYEYRDNSKNTSDSSSGCEDDFDADENYGINDGDEHELNGIDSTVATTALNLSPMPHFPPPPDYPPPLATSVPSATAAARLQQTPQRSRYYYYENTNTNNKIELMNGGSRLRVGSLDRDCGYTTDGNEICCSQYNNRQNGGGGGSNALSNGSASSHSANNSFSSTSSSSNSSVVMHKMKIPPQSQTQQMRYPASNNSQQPNDFESIEIFTTEQEKRFPHKTLASLSSKNGGKNRMHHHDGIRSACSNGISNGVGGGGGGGGIGGGGGGSSSNISQNINVVEMLEQNLIPCGGSAASFAREAAKFHGNATEPQVKWVRTNISATMERFHPSPSTSKHNHHHSVTAAAAGAAEHLYQQIDESPRTRYDFETNQLHHISGGGSAGPSRPPPPNSMRALMMTANRNALKMSPQMRHMYTTRYGTQENIYEEITSEERLRLLSGGHSMMSLHQSSSVEEEFRRVQSRHRRILGELNLSVEAMLMPSTPPSESPIGTAAAVDGTNGTMTTHEPDTPSSTKLSSSTTRLNELLNVVGPTDELLSPVSIHAASTNMHSNSNSNNNNNNTGDIDSGFSGSSSSGGASYLGSLRYKNGLPTRSSTPNGHSSASSCRSSQRSNEDPGILMISTRSSPFYGNGIMNGSPHGTHTLAKAHRFRSAEDPGPNATYKDGKVIVNGVTTAHRNGSSNGSSGGGGFWSRKSWRKIPGFSSNNSVNKAGLNNV